MKKLAYVLASIIAVTVLMVTAVSAEEGQDATKVKTSPYPADFTYSQTGMSVVFSHEMHVDMMGYTCADCHEDVFDLKEGAARENGDFVMNSMYEGKYCGHCHDGDAAFDASEFNNCGSCHTSQNASGTVKVVGPENDLMLGSEGTKARFSHNSHQEMFGCGECHTSLFPIKFTETITSMDEIYEGKACGTCHNGDFAFAPDDCGICHPDM